MHPEPRSGFPVAGERLQRSSTIRLPFFVGINPDVIIGITPPVFNGRANEFVCVIFNEYIEFAPRFRDCF